MSKLVAAVCLCLYTGVIAAEECFPPCRSGYVCHRGHCVSRCNPPCPAGTECTPGGECREATSPVPRHQAKPAGNATPAAAKEESFGWVKVTMEDENVRLFVDGEFVGKGSRELKLPIGVHRIMAKSADDSETELVTVYENDVTRVEFDVEEDTGGRNVRFYMGFDGSWMLGDEAEFGPSHIVGIEIAEKHLVALNYYWGLKVFSGLMFGGGGNYLFTFNVHDVFLARLGAVAGFWLEEISYYDSYYSSGYYYSNWGYRENIYFGGPKVRIEVGFRKVYFTGLDATLLLGPDGPKALLNTGISFRL